jgi:hypothetical protein
VVCRAPSANDGERAEVHGGSAGNRSLRTPGNAKRSSGPRLSPKRRTSTQAPSPGDSRPDDAAQKMAEEPTSFVPSENTSLIVPSQVRMPKGFADRVHIIWKQSHTINADLVQLVANYFSVFHRYQEFVLRPNGYCRIARDRKIRGLSWDSRRDYRWNKDSWISTVRVVRSPRILMSESCNCETVFVAIKDMHDGLMCVPAATTFIFRA